MVDTNATKTQTLGGARRTLTVDVVVVYKIDRLTRSLADFARMVELFDRHKVSFVVSGPGCCCYLPQLKLSFSVTGG